MKLKRILSMLMAVIMTLGLTASPAFAENAETISVFVNVTKYGQIAADKDNNAMALAPVELSGKESYTLDDLFKALHNTYYEGGDEGYASQNGDYGLYITKFWGDESGNFGYQVNGGTENVMGLSHEVKNGDCVDAVIYKNTYPDTESYAKFDKYEDAGYIGEEIELTLTQAGYDENYNMVFSPCEGAVITGDGAETGIVTDENGKAALSFDTPGTYIISASKEKIVNDEAAPAISAPVCRITVKDYPDACITVPNDAKLFVGTKGRIHFVSFTQVQPLYIASDEANTKYYFELADNATYNFRVSGDNYVTYAGTFKKTQNFSLTITDGQLNPEGKTKKTPDTDTSSNNGCNVADIYLNINPQGYLKLSKDETYQIVSLRNWEAVNSTVANYFIEPDYHYEVIDENGNESDVVTIDENGLLCANRSGDAIVLVTYDAMTLNFGSGDVFYGATWPENTGVFVVSVDSAESGIETGITINEGKNDSAIKLSGDALDSEHDCIYFAGDMGSYTFTPVTEGLSVSVANPVIDTKTSYNGFNLINAGYDGSFCVPLTEGRNIVKLEKDGKCEYQIITAKKVNITVNGGEEVHPGDTLKITFDKLYHPANKLAGVYNASAVAIYSDVSGYDGKIIGASSAQYNFANNQNAQAVSNVLKEKDVFGLINYVKDSDLVIPDGYAYDTFTLSGGTIYTNGWGDSYGNHRYITYENGKAPNLNADAKPAYFGRLPDIQIPVVSTSSALTSISLNTDNVKTSYFSGDRFDTTNLTVTANYEDNTTQIAVNYTVSPEVLTADTEKVTVTYKTMSADIPVSVVNPKVCAIEITSPPTKTTYTEGEMFNPSGMVVSAVYENGEKEETTDYSYSPNRELLASDTEMLISYKSENGTENISAVSLPITVREKTSGGSGGSSDKITVYFTLLGDEKHGTPSEGEAHTKKAGNLQTWISKTKITLDKGGCVMDAVEKALSLNGIPYTAEDNYISKINGLSEFDNGEASGWMYTLNGRYPSKGISEQKLSNGDAIIFHYTDDYTAEKTGYSSGGSGGSGGSSSAKDETPPKEDSEKTDEKEEIQKPDKPVFTESTYEDVKPSDWHYEAVKYAYENNLMLGTDKGFEPESTMTRAMLITVLWRMENEPVINYALSFDDVEPGEWYTEAVRWAAGEKIISGTDGNNFGTNDEITREQLSTILYRYMQAKNIDTSALEDTALVSYTDGENISEYAVPAVKWAVGFGLIKGKTTSTLCPADSATRAEAAAMLMRFCKGITK